MPAVIPSSPLTRKSDLKGYAINGRYDAKNKRNSNADGLNQKNHFFPLNTVIKAYEQASFCGCRIYRSKTW